MLYTMFHMTLKLQADYKRAFKDADIRAVYPKEIDDELVYYIARAFVEEYGYTKILVAHDTRLSTPALHEAFLKGATDSGASVIDIGLVHTPALYYASGTMELPGVMITASHSPKEYNGLKLVHAGALPLTEKNGLGVIRRRIEKGKFTDAPKRGKVTKKDVLKGYLRYVLKGYKPKQYKDLQVVADVGNGMAGILLPLLQPTLPTKFTVLFGKLDGNFPNHGLDPALAKNQRQLKTALKDGKYDFGIGFDGDADRIAFHDEKGTYINSAVIGALIADRMLKRFPGEKIGYTNLTSKIYEETIRKAGGKPMPVKVGHAFIKEAMRKNDILFACEHSAHFYYKKYFYTDSVIITLLEVMEACSEAKSKGMTLSELVKPYCIYQQTEDTIVKVKDRKLALQKTEAYLMDLKPKKITRFDGLRVDFGDVWGAVIPSVTEYALKFMFESTKKKLASDMQSRLVEFVKSIAQDEK